MQRQIILIALLLVGSLLTLPCAAQEEVAGADRYRMREASSGYYRESEVTSSRGSPFVQWSAAKQPITSGGRAPASTYAADAHAQVANFQHQRCESCHKAEAHNNRHVTRRGVNCRQCHGYAPIAGINHYFSPLNPIRRHAMVCAKCHQGANNSFAMYVVHEPSPLLAGTAEAFPVLYWAVWIMVIIAIGTFALFLPHTGLWMLRELFARKNKGGEE